MLSMVDINHRTNLSRERAILRKRGNENTLPTDVAKDKEKVHQAGEF